MTDQWEVTFQKAEKVPAIAPEGWEPFAISPSSDCTVAGIWLRRRVTPRMADISHGIETPDDIRRRTS
jgi:hypothetical protein